MKSRTLFVTKLVGAVPVFVFVRPAGQRRCLPLAARHLHLRPASHRRRSHYPPRLTPTFADTDTPPEPPTPIPLTPTLAGPAIAHFAPGQKIDITTIHMADAAQGWGLGGLNKASRPRFPHPGWGPDLARCHPARACPRPGCLYRRPGVFPGCRHGLGGLWAALRLPGARRRTSRSGKRLTAAARGPMPAIDTSLVSGEAFSPYYLSFAGPREHGWLLVFLGGGMSHAYVAFFQTVDGGATWTDILDPFHG